VCTGMKVQCLSMAIKQVDKVVSWCLLSVLRRLKHQADGSASLSGLRAQAA